MSKGAKHVLTLACPDCGQIGTVRPIKFGYPGEQMMQASIDEEIILGGCCITDNDPDYGCLECDWAGTYDAKTKALINLEEDEFYLDTPEPPRP